MVRFYYRLARKVPALIHGSTSTVQGITATVVTLGAAVGPWLAQYGGGDLATYAAKVPAWWSAVPVGLLVILGLLKANYALHASVEGELDAATARLSDRQQRQQDAEELGKLRKTMRKRYYEWRANRQGSFTSLPPKFPGASQRAREIQDTVATLLEESYGYDIADRFLTADDLDSRESGVIGTVLAEPAEFAGRIKRLRGIIREIRRGHIRRRVR